MATFRGQGWTAAFARSTSWQSKANKTKRGRHVQWHAAPENGRDEEDEACPCMRDDARKSRSPSPRWMHGARRVPTDGENQVGRSVHARAIEPSEVAGLCVHRSESIGRCARHASFTQVCSIVAFSNRERSQKTFQMVEKEPLGNRSTCLETGFTLGYGCTRVKRGRANCSCSKCPSFSSITSTVECSKPPKDFPWGRRRGVFD